MPQSTSILRIGMANQNAPMIGTIGTVGYRADDDDIAIERNRPRGHFMHVTNTGEDRLIKMISLRYHSYLLALNYDDLHGLID